MLQQKPILLSVELDEHEMIAKLRQLFGTGEDLDAWEARTLYSGLLPRVLAHDTEQPLPELWCRARAAAIARRAAKRYVRERSQLLVRLFAHLIDATRHFSRSGTWSVTGASVEELTDRYVMYARDVLGDDDERVLRLAYSTLIAKSCTTNRMLDDMFLDDSVELHRGKSDDWQDFLVARASGRQHRRAWGPVVRAKWVRRRFGRQLACSLTPHQRRCLDAN